MNSARLKEIMTVQSKAGVGRLELNFETAFEVVEALEQAEQDAYGFRKGHEILNNALIKQGERLEQVEQAVARVKELVSEYRETIPEEVLHSVMKDILRALDGDTRG